MATKLPRWPDGDLNGSREPNGDQNGLLSRLVTKMPAWPNGDLIRTAIDLQKGLEAKSNGFWCYRCLIACFQGRWFIFRPQIGTRCHWNAVNAGAVQNFHSKIIQTSLKNARFWAIFNLLAKPGFSFWHFEKTQLEKTQNWRKKLNNSSKKLKFLANLVLLW